MTTKEIWLKIKGYPYYMVSNKGRVKSLPRYIKVVRFDSDKLAIRYIRGGILKLHADKDGYFHVGLRHNYEGKRMYVHRLVAIHFIGKPPRPDSQVMHKDDNIQNNVPGNLKWGTNLKNMQDKVKKGRQARGSENGESVLTEEEVEKIARLIRRGTMTQQQIADKFHVSQNNISHIKLGRTWAHVTGF